MKKIILSFLLTSLTAFVFGQSVTLTPTGDEILIQTYGSAGGGSFYGRNAGGTATAPTATTINSSLTLLGARGHNGSGYPSASQGLIGIYANQNFSTTALGTHIRFETTDDNTTTRAERMRIAPNGNVGIGTNSPSSRLHLAIGSIVTTPDASSLLTLEHTGDVGLSMLSGSASASKIFFGSSLGNIRGQITYSPTSNNMTFGTNALTRMTIGGNGNVGIGTISSGYKLHIHESTSGVSADFGLTNASQPNSGTYLYHTHSDGKTLIYNSGIGAGGIDIYSPANITLNGSSGGNVGIGTTTPTAKLDVEGDIRIGTNEITAGTTTYDPINPNGKSHLFFNPGGSATYTVKGITAPIDLQSGHLLHITSSFGVTLILRNDDATTTNNAILTSTGADVTISNRGGATLMYVSGAGATGAWIMIGLAQ